MSEITEGAARRLVALDDGTNRRYEDFLENVLVIMEGLTVGEFMDMDAKPGAIYVDDWYNHGRGTGHWMLRQVRNRDFDRLSAVLA